MRDSGRPHGPGFGRLTLPILLVTAIAATMMIGPSVAAQTSEAPIKRVVPPSGSTDDGPPPLLREGGILVDVPGRIGRDERLGVHVFRPAPARTGGVRRAFVLLPSRGLEDLARIETLRKNRDEDALAGEFQVTGRVLVYRGRNFLLPESIVPIEPTAGEAEAEEPADADADVDVEDDLAADIEARLESRIGAVPRSLDLSEAPASEEVPIRAGTRFVDRRGQVVRDPESGVWRFVPAGDAARSGVVLLPCLELQRLEQQSRQRAVSAPLLVSGLITGYRGRNYLLPTAVRRAEEGRGIGP